MSHREFVYWYALYSLEAREREESKNRAEGHAKANRMARGLAGF